jgi:hypothetical protein
LLEGYLIQPESGLKASTSVRSAAQRPRCSQIKRPFQILDSPPLPPFTSSYGVPNSLTDENGRKVKLEKGAEVDLKIEADSRVTKAEPSHEDGGYPPRP